MHAVMVGMDDICFWAILMAFQNSLLLGFGLLKNSDLLFLRYDTIPAKYTGFPGIIPGFSVSSRYPGISAKYTGLSRISASPPGIPELVPSIPGIGD